MKRTKQRFSGLPSGSAGKRIIVIKKRITGNVFGADILTNADTNACQMK